MLTGAALVALVVGWLGSAGYIAKLDAHLRVTNRVSIVLSAAHSNIEVAADGGALYFLENGANGMVMKQGSLSDGHTEIVARFGSAFVGSVFSIPESHQRVIVAKQFGDAKSPRSLSFVDVGSGRETSIDVGRGGSDGRVTVSPGGKLFGVGTSYGCAFEDRSCDASVYSIFDAASGRRIFDYPLPKERVSLDIGGDTGGNRSAPGRIGLLVPRTVHKAGWLSESELVLGTSGSGSDAAFSWIALVRESDVSWKAVNRPDAVISERRQALTPIDSEVVLRRGLEILRFRAGDFQGQALISAGDKVVVLNQNRVDATKDRIDVSLLEWRDTQP